MAKIPKKKSTSDGIRTRNLRLLRTRRPTPYPLGHRGDDEERWQRAVLIFEILTKISITMAVFILDDALSVWTNLGKHLLFVWLFVSSIKTGTRQIIRLYPS